MTLTKQNRKNLLAFTLAVLFIHIVALLTTGQFPFDGFTVLCYGALISVWQSRMYLRIVSRRVRRLFTMLVLQFFLWYFLQMCKYSLFSGLTDLARYIWYAYYIPMTLVPLLSYYISRCIGRADDEPAIGKAMWLLLPAAALILLVFTNDYHRFVFDFPHGIHHGDTDYLHGAGYYMIAAWVIFCILLSLITAVRRSELESAKAYFWLAGIPILLGLFYAVLFLLTDVFILQNGTAVINFQQTYTIIFILYFESLLAVGLIRSNQDYDRIFQTAGTDAIIVDASSNIAYRAGDFDLRLQNQLTGDGEKLFPDGTRLHRNSITGGAVLWTDDVGLLMEMQNRLTDVNEQLREEGEILNAEKEFLEKEASLKIRTKIYDNLSASLSDTVQKIETLLGDTGDPRKRLIYVSVLGAYMKRWGNLTLLSETRKTLSAQELFLSIGESLLYLRQTGLSCAVSCRTEREFETLYLRELYERFERYIEALFAEELFSARLLFQIEERDGLPVLSVCRTANGEEVCYVLE